ncbi:ABC transporter substrate-binding protein [Kutzneria buriramensis]|uniref:ABC-type nitrate/sulfonate/bicarbonate transport system substrate-binding protein n=1 Tax=Kutzneria buriramensis TaxID=1045776 RepID=A0A3E0HNV9_9PSEU|nr:ABC transporter substrate-binding protein [Kutzneria buriramensis]REH48193.1 ABC-type nitrate/sulfonate/bicarbonate transport system substrate-binding protein [Kutzneria buriramensis]
MKRRTFLAAAGATVLTACGTASGSATKTLRYQGSAGAVTLPELAADLGFLGDVKLDWVGNTISGPQDIQSAATGQTDFGGAFNGAVVKLAAAGAPIKAVIGYYGSDQYAYNGFYVLEDSPIRTPADLAGKKVGMNTLGAHLEAMLDIYLQRNNVDPKKAEPLVVPPINTEQSLRQKQIDVATLGGILRDKALQSGGIRKLFTDYELLGPFTAGTYVFTEKFLKQNPDTVRAFVTGVGKAIEWSRATPSAQVVDRMTRIVQKRGRNEDGSALKFWKSWGVAEKGGRVSERQLSMWVDWLAGRGELGSRKLDISSLYTNEFNGVPA